MAEETPKGFPPKGYRTLWVVKWSMILAFFMFTLSFVAFAWLGLPGELWLDFIPWVALLAGVGPVGLAGTNITERLKGEEKKSP